MSGERLRVVIGAAGLVIGGLLGMAGSFAPSAALRGIAWGIDGMANGATAKVPGVSRQPAGTAGGAGWPS